MDLFDENKHLTDYAFNILVNNIADDTQKFDISSHMCCCDKCISKYSNILSNIKIMQIEKSVANDVMRVINENRNSNSFISDLSKKDIKYYDVDFINKNHKFTFIKQYITFAVASCFALLFWHNGIFLSFSNDIKYYAEKRDLKFSERSIDIYESGVNFKQKLYDNIKNIFDINLKGDNYGEE